MADELKQPSICSATVAEPGGKCTVTSIANGRHRIEIGLTAATAIVDIGGYKVSTENYNGNYVTPVVEALPGDTVAAHLVNALTPKPAASPAPAHAGMHGDPTDNPTNLHYFHGGIVSPKNTVRPKPGEPETGNGDNIYVHLKSGTGQDGKPNSFDFDVQIPGDKMLDAGVLEQAGNISHPVGLNWYHSHQHGISSPQVMGGMSGLLSVGEATANVKAACVKNSDGSLNCDDVETNTSDLRSRTKVRYAILRDIALANIAKLPADANGDTADFDSSADAVDFSTSRPPCGVWKTQTSTIDVTDKAARAGFCQRDQKTALLFTLNGQRFPTITVPAGQNLLLRLGNLSANLPYWLELQGADGTDGKPLPLTLLSLDGVVPALPTLPGQVQKPVQALNDANLLLMPAARAEIYVRNDVESHSGRTYILRTREHAVNQEVWPEIQLARIVLEPNTAASKTMVALNVPVATPRTELLTNAVIAAGAVPRPAGCLRDLDRNFREFRRVKFNLRGTTSDGRAADWSIRTEIVRPDPNGAERKDQGAYNPNPQEDPKETTLAGPTGAGGVPFEEYVEPDGSVNWTKRHVCIELDKKNSHKQLWVLVNGTRFLHNFHIHQMKFRLATAQELKDDYQIEPPTEAQSCTNPDPTSCPGPNYEFYDAAPNNLDPGATRRWHDTIPIPPQKAVFVVMSFDAHQQIGRFVFHCHILKHEDKGLMAPIEVWDPKAL